MGLKRVFLHASIFALVYACGTVSASFPYRYYNLKPDNFSGRLEGDRPEHDLPLETCKGTQGKQNPCTVFLTQEFEKLKTDYQKLKVENQDLRERLKYCQ